MKQFLQFIFGLFGLLVVVFVIMTVAGIVALFNGEGGGHIPEKSILALELDGVITSEHAILEQLRKYRKEDSIKGVLIRINSPGGVVGPSQELFSEILRTRKEFKKPVVVHCESVAASGAYYAAVAADKIVTTPGCMIGSIGALMEFVNLEGLYTWAKVQRYSITTGKYKNAGAEYKPMTTDERALFQEMLDDVLSQFKAAIIEGRGMKPDFLNQYADGRVFTGQQAVKLGFADQVGTWDDARKILGGLTGLGDDPEIFEAKKRRGFREFLEEATESKFSNMAEQILKTELNARPLYLLPGAVRF